MKPSGPKWTRFRINLVLTAFVLVCLVVIWRAFQLQVLERKVLAQMADRQSHTVIKLNPVRGEIFDRNGVKLAVSVAADSVVADPTKIRDPDQTADRLAEMLDLNRQALARKLKSKSSFVWIKRQIDPKTADRIKALDLNGVDFVKESKRFYPNKHLASHLLGFVGVDSRGLEGLELGYDRYLRGDGNRWRVKRDALGHLLLDQENCPSQKLKGDSIHLTLDSRIQFITEKALTAAVEAYGARRGIALVVRPQTGEILATAITPNFNPNVYRQYSQARRRNRVVTDNFDPGSTFKVFVVAAAL